MSGASDRRASVLWRDLYAATFGRSRHPELWEAMVARPTSEKVQIDEDAEKLIAAALIECQPYRAEKVTGGYHATGWVVAEFQTRAGKPRVVFEFDAIPGMLHIFAPEQIRRL